MKKLNFTLLILSLICCAAFGQVSVDPNRDPTAARDDLINVVPATGRTNLSVYSKAESDVIAANLESLLAQGSLKYYYGTATDSVTGGRLFTTSAISTASSIVFPALSSTAYTWVNSPGRLTPAGSPGLVTLLASTIEVSRYYSCDQAVSTGRSVTGINELWEVDADGSGNPEFIATSSEYVIFGTEMRRISYSYTIATDVTLGATRRLQERNYRKRTGVLTGANPVVTAYYGGSRSGLMSIQVPSEVVMLTNAANADVTTARTNLSVYSKAEIGAIIATETLEYIAAIATETAERDAHEASTTTAVHGLGTMSGETATNYVGSAGANISGAAFRAALGVYSSAELATYSAATSADLTGSNITATTTFLAAIGGAKVGGAADQDFAAKDLTAAGKISQNVASNGYTIYQGNTAVSAAGEASKQLPIDGSTTSLTLASGTCGYAVAEVTGKLESTNSMCHVRLSWSFEMLDNTYSIVGNPASTTDQLNAATWSVSLGSDGNLYASGTPDAIWQVKKLEIGGL